LGIAKRICGETVNATGYVGLLVTVSVAHRLSIDMYENA